jgi:putative phage-type endonuclease
MTEFDRTKFIGGSEIAAVCGVSPWATPLDIYYRKRGLVDEQEMTAPMEMGLFLEEPASKLYSERYGVKLRRRIKEPVLTIEDFPWYGATPDREIVGDPKGVGVFELKCPQPPALRRIKEEGIPPHYILQVQWYLMHERYRFGLVVVFGVNAMEFEVMYLAPDVQLQSMMI